jgi:hypothetical protein
MGAFYVWGPARSTVGKLLGYSPPDLLRGGRLQRLNRSNDSDFNLSDRAAEAAGRPQDAISFFRQSRAQRQRLLMDYTTAGDPHPSVAADRAARAEAIAIIKAHPWRHLMVTIPLLWRGANVVFPVLAVALAFSLYARRYDLALFTAPAFGSVMFHALLTHFIPRYAQPTYSISMLVAIVLLAWLVSSRLARSRTVATVAKQNSVNCPVTTSPQFQG